ncbi:hypothetical protein FRC10_011658 [Ceratobasidium sp. 414]|nr:hypothetical protein FRC10_011658 [Ceratobasidium sp. 414]
MLALPTKNHRHLLSLLSSPSFTHSPIMTETLRTIVKDIMELPLMLSRDLWLQIWERWGVNRPLGEVFSRWLETNMRAQGIIPPFTYISPPEKTYTVGATHFGNDASSAHDSPLAALTAAAQSTGVSARLLLGIAHSLIHGFFPKPPGLHRPPDESFISVLIEGLVRRKAYIRAQAVWRDAEQKIASSRKNIPPSPSAMSRPRQVILRLTPGLFEAGLSSYARAGDQRRALKMLDRYAIPAHHPLKASTSSTQTHGQHRVLKPRRRPHVTPSALNAVLPYLPPHAQQLVFSHSAQRWGIQPDSTALETVMQGALWAVRDWRENDQGLLENLREFWEGFRQILRGKVGSKTAPFSPNESGSQDDWGRFEAQLNIALDPAHQNRDRPLIQQNAIELFQSVVLGNWPFIASSGAACGDDEENLLAPKVIALFSPTPLRRRTHSKASNPRTPDTFSPAPLHPSPTPQFPNAHPTPRAWTAYLALLPAEDIPEGLGWMRAADESMRRTRKKKVGRKYEMENELHIFRPEKVALIDALVRWEAMALAGETPLGRALNERVRRARLGGKAGQNEVGPEGALRAWLVDWLGPPNVPSREEVARARLVNRNMEGGGA